MRIGYDSSLWIKGKGSLGLVQKTSWQLEYTGAKRCIPIIYRFPKGIVFDILTFLDETNRYDSMEYYLGTYD